MYTRTLLYTLNSIVCLLFFQLNSTGSTKLIPKITPSALQNNPIVQSFTPDIHIKDQSDCDHALSNLMRPFFYSPKDAAYNSKNLCNTMIRNYGGQEIMLLTDDGLRISSLYFKRKNAPINLIYIPGYFFDTTPPKEWCVPFAHIFENFNILAIDWRGVGSSEGITSMFQKNSFGKNAYPDIQAALEFMKKENDKPVVLIGFCFGAAMILHAMLKAMEGGRTIADALVLNCVFTRFENQFKIAELVEQRFLYQLFFATGLARYHFNYGMDGSLFDLNPIEMIRNIRIPCYFEHYTYDPFTQLSEGIQVYSASPSPKMFMQSDWGGHVYIHRRVPHQYKEAFLKFLKIQKLLEQ